MLALLTGPLTLKSTFPDTSPSQATAVRTQTRPRRMAVEKAIGMSTLHPQAYLELSGRYEWPLYGGFRAPHRLR
jgi:pectin methylesterase-like acyl-CoA thioesterase